MKNKISIPPSILISYGCVNCIWRVHGQCPTPGSLPSSGICPAYHEFLLSFDDDSGDLNSLLEKFNLYLTELEHLDGYKKMVELGNEIKELENSVGPNERSEEDVELLNTLETRRHTHRLWWVTLNRQVLNTRGRICDRESKVKGDDGHSKRMTIQELENFMNTHLKELDQVERKQLEDKS